MPEGNAFTTDEKKNDKKEKGPCTGDKCTIDMCRRCHEKAYQCSASKVTGENEKNT